MSMRMAQTCKKCRRVQRFEWIIRDEIWNQIDELYRDTALCFECFLEELNFANSEQVITIEDFVFMGILDPSHDDSDCMKDLHPNFGGILLDIVQL